MCWRFEKVGELSVDGIQGISFQKFNYCVYTKKWAKTISPENDCRILNKDYVLYIHMCMFSHLQKLNAL